MSNHNFISLDYCENFTSTWTIHNFDVAPHLTGESLESPVFSFEALGRNRKFSLLLYPRYEFKDENYVSLAVKPLYGSLEKLVTMEYELSLIDANRRCVKTGRLLKYDLCEDTQVLSQSYKRSVLLSSLKQTLLPDNKLTVLCRLKACQYSDDYPYEDDDDEESVPISIYQDGGILSRDLAELLETGIHSDLVIEAEGKEFRVHKPILEARCPKIIPHLVKAGSSDVMTLPNLEASTLQDILHYIYTGRIKDVEKFGEVYAVINRYEIPRLKRLLCPKFYSTSAETVIECFQVSYEWTILDFKNFPQSNKELYQFLISDEIPESCWLKVTLFANEGDDGHKNMFLRCQKLQSYYFGAIHLAIKASNRKDEQILIKESVNVFENGMFKIPLDIVVDSVKLQEDGSLKLCFDIRMSMNGEQSSVRGMRFKTVTRPNPDYSWIIGDLHYHMYYFYENMTTGDVILNIGSKKLTAHKAVLCSRSQVFRKMFEHDSLERQTNTVNIEDVDEEIMMSVLMYMYCGNARMWYNMPKVVKLYIAADKYLLLHLKEECCQSLKSLIDADNVGDLLLLADAHSDEVLKKHVYEFITGNASKILQSQTGLKVLENRGELYRDIMNALLHHVSLEEKRE